MNINQILEIGAQAFQSSIGGETASSLPVEQIMSALAGLMPGEGGQVDLGALIGSMQSSGLGSVAESWLSDGGNAGVGTEQLASMFDSSDIQRFADKLGLHQDTAVEGLKGAVPEMIDKASSNGALESMGGIGGVMAMAGKLFGR